MKEEILMQWLQLLLNMYLAAILWVAGLAKMEHLNDFAATLRNQRLLPQWSIQSISYLLPWIELVLSVLLVFRIAPVLISIFVSGLFLAFAAAEGTLLITKRSEDCGCYGIAYARKIDVPSVITSSLLAFLALVHFGLVFANVSIERHAHLVASILILAFYAVMIWRVVRPHLPLQESAAILHREVDYMPIASRLQLGDCLPVDLGMALPTRAFLLFVGTHCPPCIELCQSLAQIRFDDWSLIVIVNGQQGNDDQISENSTVVPSYAHHLNDPAYEWYQSLSLHGTPTVLAFDDKHLVAQRLGVTVSWFVRFMEKSRNDANILLSTP